MPWLGSVAVLLVAAYTWLTAVVEWKRGNRFGGVGLVAMGLGTLALGVYLSFRK